MRKKSSSGTDKKTALELRHNGRRIAVGGLLGRAGVLTASVSSIKGNERPGDLRLILGGLDSGAEEHLRWIHKSLQMGDEVVIRVIDSDKISPVKARHKQDNPKKNNIAWIRELSKKLGYKLVKVRKK